MMRVFFQCNPKEWVSDMTTSMYNRSAGGNRGSAIHLSFSISGRTDTLLSTYVLWSLG